MVFLGEENGFSFMQKFGAVPNLYIVERAFIENISILLIRFNKKYKIK